MYVVRGCGICLTLHVKLPYLVILSKGVSVCVSVCLCVCVFICNMRRACKGMVNVYLHTQKHTHSRLYITLVWFSAMLSKMKQISSRTGCLTSFSKSQSEVNVVPQMWPSEPWSDVFKRKSNLGRCVKTHLLTLSFWEVLSALLEKPCWCLYPTAKHCHGNEPWSIWTPFRKQAF